MDFDNDNLLDQFLQQSHDAQIDGSFGLRLSNSHTPVPMSIPGSHGELDLDSRFGISASMSHASNTSKYGVNDNSEPVSTFRNVNSQHNVHLPQSRQQSITGRQVETGGVPASFMDEYISPTTMLDSDQTPKQDVDHINLDETTRNLFDEPMFREHFQGSQVTDDLVSNFTDDLVSSLGSSINSEMMTPVSSYQPQRLNSFDSHSFNQMSSSLRSPSASYRGASQLSSSLRSSRGSQQLPTSNSLTSTPKDMISSSLTQDEKIRRRREFHNAVERRRRELIKAKIKELGTLVPPSLLHFDEFGKKVKPNKGTILKRTTEYMDCLRQVLEIQDTKKEELSRKINELERRKAELANTTLLQPEIYSKPANNYQNISRHPSSVPHSIPTEHYQESPQIQHHQIPLQQPLPKNEYIRDEDDYPERIIDSRAYPVLGNGTRHGASPPNAVHDDLQQFLSGTLMETEDNNRLMFNGRTENTVDLLLDFEE
ncbi:unnamed protein product [Kluyveromyces dobzhanskii CBS 2104]|uniref:WGS project CCBQ000000000 data, contig 00106 n=1 Tax=Kluyveromyces dobzhanskii CBS 2104 TaxID=1427455 RepID=A0A0A8L8D6_9SACH|nr:unnamed protein product [Kluyveromyces dobzhanskii CBS 2104]